MLTKAVPGGAVETAPVEAKMPEYHQHQQHQSQRRASDTDNISYKDLMKQVMLEMHDLREDLKPLFKLMHGNGAPGLIGSIEIMRREMVAMQRCIDEITTKGSAPAREKFIWHDQKNATQDLAIKSLEDQWRDFNNSRTVRNMWLIGLIATNVIVLLPSIFAALWALAKLMEHTNNK